MEHGSGYTKKERNNYWRVSWKTSSLTENSDNPPSKVTYLGKYEANRERGTSDPVSETGLDMEMSYFTSNNHVLVWKKGRDLSPKIPVVDEVHFEGTLNDEGKHMTVLTPSRQHMLVWGKPFLVCQTSDLKAVLEIEDNEATAKLRHFHDTAFGIHDIELTDDLRYIAVVPHNGNDSRYGHNHHRIWVYDIARKAFFENSFAQEAGNTAVESVQSWQGRLYFLIHSHTQDFDIFDEAKHPIAKIPSDRTVINGSNANLLWQPNQQTVWIAKGVIDSGQRERTIGLRKFNYATNTSTDYELKAGPLKVP